MAIEKESAFGAYEITRVESAYEADVPAENPVAVADGELCLHDGAASFFTVQFGAQGKREVDVAVVPQCEILAGNVVAVEVKQGEISYRTHCLSPITGQYDLRGVIGQTFERQPGAAYDETVGRTALLRTAYLGVVGIVDPIDPGGEIEGHGFFCASRCQMTYGLVHRRINIRERLGNTVGQ